MPTIFVFLGLRFFFYSNENQEPMHVHVKSGNGEAKFWLNPEIKCESNYGFNEKEIRKIKEIILERKKEISDKWVEYFNENKK